LLSTIKQPKSLPPDPLAGFGAASRHVRDGHGKGEDGGEGKVEGWREEEGKEGREGKWKEGGRGRGKAGGLE